MAVKPGMSTGAAGDGQGVQSSKRRERRAALFQSCFLCTAVHHDQGKDNVEETQGECRQTRAEKKSLNDNKSPRILRKTKRKKKEEKLG